MDYYFRIYQNNRLLDMKLNPQEIFTIGSGEKDSLLVDGLQLKKQHLMLQFYENTWRFSSASPVHHNRQELTEGIVTENIPLVISQEFRFAVTLIQRQHNPTEIFELSSTKETTIGKSDRCDIVIKDPQISGTHLMLRYNDTGWELQDCNSTNGTYYNQNKISKTQIDHNSSIDMGLCHLVFSGNLLKIWSNDIISSPVEVASHVTIPPPIWTEKGVYPYEFKRSPRVKEELPSGVIEIQAPPQMEKMPQINWLSVFLTPFLTVSVMAMAAFLVGSSFAMLVFSAPMACVGAFMSTLNYKKQKKLHLQQNEHREQRYRQYLTEQKEKIQVAHRQQRTILSKNNPPPKNCLELVTGMDRTLWQRRPVDEDFMSLRLGLGNAMPSIITKSPQNKFSLEDDPLLEEALAIAPHYQIISNCPINYLGKETVIAGILGENRHTLAKNLVIQASTHHSYHDLKIMLLCDESDLDTWDFIKWLPHSFDDLRIQRYIAHTKTSRNLLLNQFRDVLQQRKQEHEANKFNSNLGISAPFFFLVVTSPHLIYHHNIQSYFQEENKYLGVSMVLLSDLMEDLPKECSSIIDTSKKEHIFYDKEHWSQRSYFTADSVPEKLYESFSRAMAPIRTKGTGMGKSLPQMVSFLHGYGIQSLEQYALSQIWSNASPEQSMAVPVGIASDGNRFFFDIHEKQHGPHGLVAGMTGSGKSEMVQSWILSMALHFSPSAVSFVLIDFKGTGLLLPFQNLPHLAGTISDMDCNITRNLIALQNELNRRKALLDEAGVSNITSYLQKYRKGDVTTPLSYLFIVIDEFAEFKAQFPDFMQVVNQIFAIGRTLGVHIILLTQKPANVVTDKMTANVRFRWCLKVASSADSKDMIGKADAAKLMQAGRAFVQVGENEVFEEIQSYYSGAAYAPEGKIKESITISSVDLQGVRYPHQPELTTGFRSERSEIDVIVNYLDNFTRKNNIPRSNHIWTQKLPQKIELSELLQFGFDGERWSTGEDNFTFILGLLDEPRTQSQYPLAFDLQAEGHCAVFGAPSTGKTTFLHSAMISMTLSYQPDRVHLYCLDFGGGSFQLFRQFPHVSDVIGDSDDEKLELFQKKIMDELSSRKGKLSSYGFLNTKSYEKETGEILPHVVIVIDNFSTMLQLYPKLDVFFQTISRDGASFGIYLLFSSGASNSVNLRIMQNIKQIFALNMTDPSDYVSYVGRTEGLLPERVLGRGLLRGMPPLEAQIALGKKGDELQRIAYIRDLSQQMKVKWTGSSPQGLPQLPTVVDSSLYPSKDLFLGLDTTTFECIFLEKLKHTLLLVWKESGRGNKLIEVLTKAKSAKVSTALIYESEGSAFRHLSGGNLAYINSPEELNKILEMMMPELKRRQETKENPLEFNTMFLVIPNLAKAQKELSQDSLKRLKSIVTLGSGLEVYLLVGMESSPLQEQYHQRAPLVHSLVTNCPTMILDGSMGDHAIFRHNLSYEQKTIPLKEGEAYFIRENTALKLRVPDQ